MDDLCKLDDSKNCDKIVSSTFHTDITPVDLDHPKKNNVINEMFDLVKKCYKENECHVPIEIKAIGWDSCPACSRHIPRIKNKMMTLNDERINVSFQELNVKDPNGRELFTSVGCQGTPCIVIRNEDGRYEKVYEGDRGDVSAISSILGFENPLFYDISNARPKRFVKKEKNFGTW